MTAAIRPSSPFTTTPLHTTSSNNMTSHSISNPPPLPATLSSRCNSTIDKSTGCCIHHPTVKLCELVQGGTRWVVRRKICYKCGSRPGATGGKHHRPGVSVSSKRASCGDVAGNGSNSGGGGTASEGLISSSSRGRRSSRDLHSSDANIGSSTTMREKSTHRRGSSVGVAKVSSRGRSVSRERVLNHSKDVLNSIRSSSSVQGSRQARRSTESDMAGHRRHDHHGIHGQHHSAARRDPILSPAIIVNATDEEEDFDDSDPIITIPVVINPTLGAESSATPPLPPPPPRTDEEMHVHQERLELRRTHLREQQREQLRGHRREPKEDAAKKVKSRSAAAAAATAAAAASSGREKKESEKESEKDNLLTDGARDVKPRTKRWDRHRNMSNDTEDGNKGGDATSSPKRDASSPEVGPSAAALALLESHTKKVAERETKHHRGRSHHKGSGGGADCQGALVPVVPSARPEFANEEGDEFSETSSISSSSAKMYQLQPSERNLLDGIGDFPLAGAGALVHLKPVFPPVDVTVDRCRSRSRPRRSKSRDAVMDLALVPHDPPSDPPEANALTPASERVRSKSYHRRDKESHKDKSSEKDSKESKDKDTKKHVSHKSNSSVVSPSEKKSSRHIAEEERHTPKSIKKSVSKSFVVDDGDKDHKKNSSSRHHHRHQNELGALAASTARSKRRARSRSKSEGGNDHDNDDDDEVHEAKSTARSRRSKSNRSRSRTRRNHHHHSDKHGESDKFDNKHKSRSTRSQSKSRKKKEDNEVSIMFEHVDKVVGSSRGGGKGGTTASKGGRSRVTTSTQPESLSSDEIHRQITIDEEEAFEGGEEVEVAPMIIYKKRAEKKKNHIPEDDEETEFTKPMAMLCVSSDERSHASSISSNSETYYDSEEEDDDDDFGADKSRKSGKEVAKEKAMMMLNDVKGGAKSFATRGKSALGGISGLKGTSKKWQSALFM